MPTKTMQSIAIQGRVKGEGCRVRAEHFCLLPYFISEHVGICTWGYWQVISILSPKPAKVLTFWRAGLRRMNPRQLYCAIKVQHQSTRLPSARR